MGLQVLDITSKEEWENIFNEFPPKQQDVYFTPNYYQTWINHEDAEAKCFYFTHSGSKLLYPFFKKKIAGYETEQDYYDIFSAYGYGGIISNSNGSTNTNSIQKFNETITEWCKENNIVAEFIRENPMIQNGYRNAERCTVRQNVYVDTTKPYEQSKNVRENFRKSERTGLSVFIDNKLEYLDEFVRLYRITAERLCVQQFYNFPDEYFINIKKYLMENTKLIYVKKDDLFIAGMIFMFHNKRANLHLCASDFKFQDCRLNDFLFVNGINEAVRMGMDYLNIGGGTGNDSNDSLFRFKKKFGNIYKPVHIAKVLHNPLIYEKLVEEWASKNPGKATLYKDFFLKYRL